MALREREDTYRERDPRLPDIGSSGLGPRRLTPAAHDAIIAAADVHALADMRGYVRSYAAVSGGVILMTAAFAIAAVLGWTYVAVGAAVVWAPLVMVVLETRRRARRWESVISARIDQLLA